jgi:hypothetical protein
MISFNYMLNQSMEYSKLKINNPLISNYLRKK